MKQKRHFLKAFQVTNPLTWGYTLFPLVLGLLSVGAALNAANVTLLLYFTLPYHLLRLSVKRYTHAYDKQQLRMLYSFAGWLSVILPTILTLLVLQQSGDLGRGLIFIALLLLAVIKAVRWRSSGLLAISRLLFSFAQPLLGFYLLTFPEMPGLDSPLVLAILLWSTGSYLLYSLWRAPRDKTRHATNLVLISGSAVASIIAALCFLESGLLAGSILGKGYGFAIITYGLVALSFLLPRPAVWSWRQFLWLHWLIVVYLALGLDFSAQYLLLGLLLCSLLFSGLLLLTTLWHLRQLRLAHELRPGREPTVSILIPARNEEHALENILQRVVAQKYEKTEIIVLDDESGDSTASIIQGFARRGVRFLNGAPLPSGWNPKAHALQQLSSAASGKVLIFLDTDLGFDDQVTGRLLDLLDRYQLDALSVLPEYRPRSFAQALLRPLVDFWFMSLPLAETGLRRPVRDAMFVVSRKLLDAHDSFLSVKDSPTPAYSLMQRLKAGFAYQLVVPSAELDVWYEKRVGSTAASRLRYTYPVLGHDLLLALCVAVVGFLLFELPLLVLIAGGFAPSYLSPLALLCLIVYLTTFVLADKRLLGRYRSVSLLFPVSIAWEMILLVVSAVGYEIGAVSWKGRSLPRPTGKLGTLR